MELIFQLYHQIIQRKDLNVVAAKSRNYLSAKFELLTDDWTAPITVLFDNYAMILDEKNQCLVPWEVLEESGEFQVSAFCGDLHTSTCVCVPVHPSGYTEGQTPQAPSPSIYLQLTGMVQTAVNTATEVQRRADAGEFDGKQGPIGPQGPKGQDGTVSFSEMSEEQQESLHGKSAYAYAQEGGFTGTEEAFAEKLAAEYRPADWMPSAKDVGAVSTADFSAFKSSMMAQNIKVVSGKILDASGDTTEGVGIATLLFHPNGVVEIDFSVKITVAGSASASNVFSWGINRNLISPERTVIPKSGGVMTLYREGAIELTRNFYGGTADCGGSSGADYWTFARVYLDAGTVGKWSTTAVKADDIIIGTCYGIVEEA